MVAFLIYFSAMGGPWDPQQPVRERPTFSILHNSFVERIISGSGKIFLDIAPFIHRHLILRQTASHVTLLVSSYRHHHRENEKWCYSV